MEKNFRSLYWLVLCSALMCGLIFQAAGQCSPLTLTSEQDHQNMMDQLGICVGRG